MFARERYPRSVWTLLGRRRGRPRRPRTGTIRSTIMRSVTTSGTFDAVSIGGARGKPCRSTITWCLEPFFPRSVGFLPVCAPPFLRGHVQNRPTHVTSRSLLLVGAARVGAGGHVARRLRVASHGGVSSMSCRCTRSRAAGTPRGSRCAGRTPSPRRPHDLVLGDGLAETGVRTALGAPRRRLPRAHHRRAFEAFTPG